MTKLWDYGWDIIKISTSVAFVILLFYGGYCLFTGNLPGAIYGENYQVVKLIDGSTTNAKMILGRQWELGFKEVIVYGTDLNFSEGNWYSIVYRQTWVPNNWEIIKVQNSGASWGFQFG